MAALHCPACLVGWTADQGTTCWSCHAPGHHGALIIPTPPLSTVPTPRPALSADEADELASGDALQLARRHTYPWPIEALLEPTHG